MGWKISFITYDLHREPVKGDVETEYEEKFSRKGNLCMSSRGHVR